MPPRALHGHEVAAWWSPVAVVQRLPPGGADVVGVPGVGFDQAAVPQVTIGGVGIGDGGITGMYAVAEEAAGHAGNERAVAFGQVDRCGVELLNQGGAVGSWRQPRGRDLAGAVAGVVHGRDDDPAGQPPGHTSDPTRRQR